MKKLTSISLALTSLGILSGCAAIDKAEDRMVVDKKQSVDMYAAGQTKVIAGTDSQTNGFKRVDRNWVNPTPLAKVPKRPDLPELFKKKVAITMPGTVNAVEVLSELQRSSNISFKLDKDVYDMSSGIAKIISPSTSSGSEVKNTPLLISDFVFQGSLEDALNLFTAKSNLSWKWNGSFIEVFKFESVTYSISALAGSVDTKSSVNLTGDTSKELASAGQGAQTASASTSGGNSSEVTRNAKMAIWDEVKTTVLSQMSPDGTLAVAEAMGTITVRDTPFAQVKIAKTVEDMNNRLTGQIHLNVDIYEVSLKDEDNVAIDWNLAWTTIGSKSNFSFSSSGGAAGRNNSVSFGIIDGNFKGTGVMIDALSTLGKATVLNSFTVTTLSGQPAPLAINRNIGYLQSMTSETGTGDNAATKYTLIPGNISAGMNLNVKPMILQGNNLLLEYVMNLSDLEQLRTLTAPDNSSVIELPTTNAKSASQIATLKSGQTLVMSGFKQKKANATYSGLGHNKNFLMGGKNAGGIEDTYLVVTVTPYIAKSKISRNN